MKNEGRSIEDEACGFFICMSIDYASVQEGALRLVASDANC